jgi:hypothetical protein
MQMKMPGPHKLNTGMEARFKDLGLLIPTYVCFVYDPSSKGRPRAAEGGSCHSNGHSGGYTPHASASAGSPVVARNRNALITMIKSIICKGLQFCTSMHLAFCTPRPQPGA